MPADWVSVTEAAYPEPDDTETSKPVGAATVILSVKPDPERVTVWALDADPEQLENAARLALTVISATIPV